MKKLLLFLMMLTFASGIVWADDYYIVGSFTNDWTRLDAWKLNPQADGSYILNDVVIPQYGQFKIQKVYQENNETKMRWCGGAGGYWLGNDEVTAINGASHANLAVWVDPDKDAGSNYYMEVGGTSNVKFAPGNLLTVNPVTVSLKTINPSNQQIVASYDMTPNEHGWNGWTITMQNEFAVDDQFGFEDNWGVWHGGKQTQTDGNWAQIWEAQLGTPLFMSNDGNYIVKVAGKYIISVNNALNQMTANIGVTLADWLAAHSVTYAITDLRCVEVIDNKILCKDVDGAAQQAPTNSNWVDFMATYKPNGGNAVGAYTTYDHSNWILLGFADGVLSGTNSMDKVNALKGKNLKNAVVNTAGNLTAIPDPDGSYTYTPNTFIPAAFTGSNPVAATWYESWGVPPTQHENHQDCFFVQPQSMELVKIINAEWNGSAFVTHPITIRVPKEEGEGYTYVALNFLGSINLPQGYNANPPLSSGTVYEFSGYVQMLSKNRDGVSYTITPTTSITASTVVTAVEDLRGTSNNATEVGRYNVAGMKVDSNYRGVVIVVMSDGTARKVLN